MSCIKDVITDDLLSIVSHPQSDKFVIRNNTIFIPDSVRSKSGDSTFGVVRYVEKQLNERYAKLYGNLADSSLGQLTSIEPLNDGFKISINPSRSVEKAIEYSQQLATVEEVRSVIEQESAENQETEFRLRDTSGNQFFDVDGNVYATIEDMEAAQQIEEEAYDSFFNTGSNQVVVQPNYENYISHKQDLIKKMEKQIEKLYNEKNSINPPNINRKISRFTKIKEVLEAEVAQFTTASDKLELIKEFYIKDFNLINNLLTDPTLENIFLAKDLFQYIKDTADIRSGNTVNKLFNPKDGVTYEQEVIDLLQMLHKDINFQEKVIDEAVDKVFLKLLEKNQEKLEMLYPNQSLEQIKEELLKNLQDVTWIESMFFAQGENLTSSNNIIENIIRLEYEKEVLRREGEAQEVIASINAQLAGVEEELARLGKKITSSLGRLVYSGYDYRFFYQKDSNGEPKSSLVGKYSLKYERWIKEYNNSHNKALFEARQAGEWAEIEKLLISKFNDLNDKTEFVNFTLLHDVFNDAIYDEFKKGTQSEADTYKAEIISKIGQEEYDNIIQEQRNHLDTFIEERDIIISNKLAEFNVNDIDELEDKVKDSLSLTLDRLNPSKFIESYLAGTKGMIEYQWGSQRNEKPSYIKYNTIIPKAKTNIGMNTDFFDSEFAAIEKNPVLYPFWQSMRKGAQLINENLIDSNISVNKNSLLLFKKTFSEETIHKDFKAIVKHGWNAANLKQFVKDITSAKVPDYSVKNEVVLPPEVKSFNAEVYADFSLMKTDIANILKTHITDDTVLVWDKIPLDQQKKIVEILGLENAQQVKSALKASKFKIQQLKVFSERKIMEQQTMNMPLMIKALLEFSAEHKARTTALNEINIYREKSKTVKNAVDTLFDKKDTARKSENERSDFFYKTVVLNQREKDHSGNASQALIDAKRKAKELGLISQKANENEWKFVGRHFYKNFTKEEKRIYDSAIERLDTIEITLVKPSTSKALAATLLAEQEQLEKRIELLGKDYLASAIYDNVINKLSVQVGLGYNILANVKNRLQGLTSLVSRDGEFWNQGNIYSVNSFMGLNKLRFIKPEYKQEWDKTVLFIRQLNVIQDGTNEIQRAENKVKSKTRWLNPMYGTEVIEWYNQTSGILAMAMDLEVAHNTEKNPDGTPRMYRVFDGHSFPVYDIVDNVLKLKPEFSNEQNIKDLEEISSEKMVDWKIQVENMTRSLNGDYSKTGVTRIKGSIWTTPIMMFKTWLSRYISSRYRVDQKNIITGQRETGYLISTLMNKKTSFTGGMILGATGLIGIASSAPLIPAIAMISAVIAWGVHKRNVLAKNRNLNLTSPVIDPTEPIAIGEQAMFILKAATYGVAEVPLNTMFGREVVQPVRFKDGRLTPQEARDVRLMVRNMQNTIVLMMLKLAIQAFFRFNDEDEPKGELGSEQRKRYNKQQDAKKEYKARNNFLENLLTGMYQETSLAVEPTTLLTTMGSKNGLQGPMDKIIKSSELLVRYGYGQDEIQKGERLGQSKTGNALRKWFLPSLFRDLPITDWSRDTWRGGFEASMEKEWVNNEGIDGIFNSDYKKDKKEAEAKRAEIKQDVIERIETEKNIDFNDLSEEEAAKIEKKAKREAKRKSPNPNRKDYDNEQELIPEAE